MLGPRRWTGARRTASSISLYLFGLAGSEPLIAKVEETADAVRTRRAVENAEVTRDFAETTHRAKSWSRERRTIARIEATRRGLDVRFVVTNLTLKCPRTVYDTLYCARGQAENLIKAHKVHLASDRTSCRRPEANQVRLVLHTAAYWLLLTLRDAIPAIRDLAKAEFATIRMRLLKIAVRVQETASRIRLAYAARCPEAALVRGLAGAFQSSGASP
jgi:hypothetical protein